MAEGRVSDAARDSAKNERLAQMIMLSEVVINNRLNVPGFIDRVKKDTSFYKAFKKTAGSTRICLPAG